MHRKPAEKTADRNGIAAAPIALVLAAIIIGAALCWHTAARSAYMATFASAPISLRADAAIRSARMEPWNAVFAKRALVLDHWNRGAQALAAGDYNSAIALLDVAYRNDIGDAALLALYKQAQETQALASNRKAHLQHGHEGPGGALKASQVER